MAASKHLQQQSGGPPTPSSGPSPPAPLAVVSQWPPYAGYPLHLFPAAVEDDFRCIHCRQVLRAPLELSCEHLICRSCYTPPTTATSPSASSTAAASAFVCPVCHAPIAEQPHGNKPVQTLIQKLILACPYKQYGCQHTGPIGKDESVIQQHLQQCQYAPIVCAGCGSEVQRGRQSHHDKYECDAGKWRCEFCGEKVAKDEESARHRVNTFDRSLLCCHLRPCPNACTLPRSAEPTSSTPSTSSARPHKRQREEEPNSETKEAELSPPSTAGLRTALPFWQMAAHVPVCPLAPVTCAICSIEVQRRDIAQHFASLHPLKAVRVAAEERKAEAEKADGTSASSALHDSQSREKAESAEKRVQEVSAVLERKQQEWEVERSAQRDSIQQLHAARQADQRAIAALQSQLGVKKQEAEQLRQRLQYQQQQQQQQATSQSSSPSAFPPQQHMNVDLFGSSPSLFFDPQTHTGRLPHTPSTDSSPSSFSLRLATFQTTLNGLLCTNCLQPRFQLTQPGGLEPCGVFHPSGRMLTADGKYSCCGRVKGSVGCQQRPMHIFDFEALQREYPEFRDKCHNVRASTTGASTGRAEASSMQI